MPSNEELKKRLDNVTKQEVELQNVDINAITYEQVKKIYVINKERMEIYKEIIINNERNRTK